MSVLSLILPTFNESKNLPELLERLSKVLTMPHEIIVVDDDSPDRTWEVADRLKATYPHLRILRRVGRRGLSSAVTDGFGMAHGDVLMVMDSDLQHDPQLITRLYDAVLNGADIAVASRYIEGGSVGEWVTGRRLLSKTATRLAQWLPPVTSSDPMSGFFALKKSAYLTIAPKLRPTGFKILLEVLAHLPKGSHITEVPLQFQFRKHGESKLNMKVELEFLVQLLRIAVMRLGHMIRSIQVPLLVILCVVIAALLLPRVWKLRLLYLDPSIRAQTQALLQRTADQNGWLLSDMPVQEVTTERVRILHRDVYRGSDSSTCIDLAFSGSTMLPCKD